MEKDYNAEACARLIGACVLHCIERPFVGPLNAKKPVSRAKERIRRLEVIKRDRIKFADSNMVKAWCDIADIDYSRIKKLIVENNKRDSYILPQDIEILLEDKKQRICGEKLLTIF